MKWLAALSIFQSVIVVYLFMVSIEASNKLTALEQAFSSGSFQSAVGSDQPARGESHNPQSSSALSGNELRSIIREELAILTQSTGTDQQTEQDVASLADLPQEDPVGVRSDLDRIVDSGQISQRELDRIQLRIARLDSATRKAMFRELTQSINSGNVRLTIN